MKIYAESEGGKKRKKEAFTCLLSLSYTHVYAYTFLILNHIFNVEGYKIDIYTHNTVSTAENAIFIGINILQKDN